MGPSRDDMELAEREHLRMSSELAPASALPVVVAPRKAVHLTTPAARFRSAIADDLSREWSRGIGFLLATLLVCGGAVAYFTVPFEPSWTLPVSLAAVGVVGAVVGRGRVAVQLLSTGLLCVAIGLCAAKYQTARLDTPIIGSSIATEITGRVVSLETRENGRIRLVVEIEQTARPQLRYAPDRVRVSARSIPADLRPGDRIRGVVRLMPPSGPVRPGSYDFAFRSYFDGLGGVGFFLRDPVKLETPPQATLATWIETLRMTIADRVRAVLPEATGEIAAALIAGVRAGIPEPVNEDLRKTGLAHVLSISGLHMALAAGTIMAAIRIGGSLVPSLASRWPLKKIAAVAALLGSAFYLMLAGDQVAADRSFLMLAVMLGAVLIDRAALSMRNLAIAAMLIVLTSPHEVMGPSFQMSFAATAALVAGYAGWKTMRRSRPTSVRVERSLLQRIWRGSVTGLMGLAATSILAGLATTIFGAYHFQRVSPLSLIANLTAMPAVSLLVMPFAVLALALMPFGLEGPALKVMGAGIDIMLVMARWLAERSPLDAVGTIPLPAVILITLALIFACIATTRLALLAIPMLLAGLATLWLPSTPDIYISEDARLVGMRTPQGALAVNRARPNGFTVEDWQRSIVADTFIKPVSMPKVRQAGEEPQGAATLPDDLFHCWEDRCAVRSGGISLVTTPSVAVARSSCETADFIVIEDATAANVCEPHARATVVTQRHLAQAGSAAIFDAAGTPEIRHAIAQPYRPWHAHRQFSREARGMPPYQRKPRQQPIDAASAEPQPEATSAAEDQ